MKCCNCNEEADDYFDEIPYCIECFYLEYPELRVIK